MMADPTKYESRLDFMEKNMDRVDERLDGALSTISQAVEKISGAVNQLVIIDTRQEERNIRQEQRHIETKERFDVVFQEIRHRDEKIDTMQGSISAINSRLDKSLPKLMETRKWVLAGLGTVLGVVLLAVVGLAIKGAP